MSIHYKIDYNYDNVKENYDLETSLKDLENDFNVILEEMQENNNLAQRTEQLQMLSFINYKMIRVKFLMEGND